MKTLKQAENLYGKLSDSIVDRILNYIENPNFDNWDDIQSLIINRNFTTIWQAVLELDPSFTTQGRSYDIDDNIIQEWEEIPEPFTVLRAIQNSIN